MLWACSANVCPPHESLEVVDEETIADMGTRTRGSVVASAILATLSLAVPTTAAGQSWTPSRTPDGQPDIQGIWQAGHGANNAGHSLEEGCCEPDHNRMQNRAADNIGLRQQIILDPPSGKIPFQPWAAGKRREHLVNLETPTEVQHIEPEDRCSLQGDSRGRWEGHTLVVETTNFRVDPVGYNKQPWIDSHGTFYTDALRVVERWRVVNANRIDYEATIEDR